LLVDYVEPATMAPFHIEGDDLQMMNNDERLAVSLVLWTNIYFCQSLSWWPWM